MVRGLGTVIYHVAGLNRAKTWYTQASNNNPTSTSRSTSVSISEGTNLGSILCFHAEQAWATARFDEALSVAATIGNAGVARSPNLDHAL